MFLFFVRNVWFSALKTVLKPLCDVTLPPSLPTMRLIKHARGRANIEAETPKFELPLVCPLLKHPDLPPRFPDEALPLTWNSMLAPLYARH